MQIKTFMPSLVSLRALLILLPLFLLSAKAAVVDATWNSATDVLVTAASYTATGFLIKPYHKADPLA